MTPAEIFTAIDEAKGNAKRTILHEHRHNPLVRRVLFYTYNPYKQYHVRPSSVPKTTGRSTQRSDDKQWEMFIDLLDKLDERELTGNAAIDALFACFAEVTATNEMWMRKVLDHHLNIGITEKTINKIVKEAEGTDDEHGIIPIFTCQLADKYWDKTKNKITSAGKQMDKHPLVAIEPKLDGYRCIAIVRDGGCTLYSRNGKSSDVITNNFRHTIVAQLAKLNQEGRIGDVVLDGELMGKNFKATQQMVLRKNKTAEVEDFYFNVFDWMPLNEWLNQEASHTCQQSREMLEDMNLEQHCHNVRLVERHIVPPSERKKYHDIYVAQGYEGIMMKTLNAVYQFKRTRAMIKYKEFEDVDLVCVGFEEGEAGKEYEGSLGAIIVENPNEGPDGKQRITRVKVGSGYSQAERDDIWANRSKYRNMVATIEHQPPMTEDGSLRFPVFKGWRPDKT